MRRNYDNHFFCAGVLPGQQARGQPAGQTNVPMMALGQTTGSTPPSAASSPAPVMSQSSMVAGSSLPPSGCSTPASFMGSSAGSPAGSTTSHGGPATPGSTPQPGIVPTMPIMQGQVGQGGVDMSSGMGSHMSSPATPGNMGESMM